MKLLRFTVPTTLSLAATDGQTALTVESRAFADGWALAARVFSDFRPEPLALRAEGLPSGAAAALLIHPWRIELWADGTLRDEEWPCGTLSLADACDPALRAAGVSVTASLQPA